MNIDRKEFAASRPAPAPKNDRQTLTVIAQAAVSAEYLTADPAWDKFLSYLQDALEKNAAARDAFMADLLNPLIVNGDEIAKRRIAVLRLNERIDILSFVISMPAKIKQLGPIATEQLKKLTEIEGASEQ